MTDHGPLCSCGCTYAEHEERVRDDWTLVGGRCLTCSECDAFTLLRDEADARAADVVPA